VKAKGGVIFKKILFPIDFSERSLQAIDYILQLKQNGLKEVVVLHVTDGDTLDKIEPFMLTDRFQQIKSKIYQETRNLLQATERELRAGGSMSRSSPAAGSQPRRSSNSRRRKMSPAW